MEEEREKKEIDDEREANMDEPQVEPALSRRQPPWTEQITVRGVIVSILLGAVYSIIVMKLNLSTGLVPNLNVSAALLAFVVVRTWTKLAHKAGYVTKPFTRQENAMIQTCAAACFTIAIGGGFASYLLGLNRKTYELSGVKTEGNSPNDVKEPEFGWMTGYLFVVCFVGLFVLIPLRKIMIVDLGLTFPTGMATAVLINGFHNRSDKTAKKQVRGFMKYFSISFLWAVFKWLYSGKDSETCGFADFPILGLQARKFTFYSDFSTTFVGAGMIVSHTVNISLLIGAVLSYGIMWPLIGHLKGHWFPNNLQESSMKSIYGYKVFISVALILGDGLYNFVKIMGCTIINIHRKTRTAAISDDENKGLEDVKQNELFLREKIPMWIGVVGYAVFSVMSIVVVPIIFPQLKWYFVVVAYILAPSLAFCNAYGTGLTDMNMAYNYGKVALFVLAAVSGKENGVVAALAGCGVIKSVVAVSSILMQDLKTGHLTYTSPRTMFLSQAIGTTVGCIMTPLSFFLYYKAFDIGNPNGEFKAPYALIYRNMAILGVEGFSALPRHCLQLCYGFFAFAVAVNMVRDISPPKVGQWLPLPMVMAVPFLIGAYFAIDMCVGSLVVFAWQKYKPKTAELMIPAVASGLICGEGLWTLPAAILALAKVKPPMCMKFADT